MKYATLGPIAVHFPEKVETNSDLQLAQPGWDMGLIGEKTGILQRYIAAENECSSDLGVAAAEKLFSACSIDPGSVDYLLFCTQSPDYALPTSACLIQHRLGLRTSIGALDFNLGCSGYVYGLAMADGLIRAGLAERVLLVTGETYTKMIHPDDRSLRTIFSDAGTATMVEAADSQSLTAFRFGTDGSGADTLIAHCGGFRPRETSIKPRGRKRWKSDLYMDGAALVDFTISAIPGLVDEVCRAGGVARGDVDKFIFHQATRKMLEELHRVLGTSDANLPIRMEHVGNTVSCTLPILIDEMRQMGEIAPGRLNMLVGFGVGWSWAGCLWQDLWRMGKPL